MTRQKFVQQYLTPSTRSTVATRKATPQDIRAAQPSGNIDWHADRKTEQE